MTKMKMDWKILLTDYYLPVVRSKYFYFAILATIASYIAVNQTLIGTFHDYLQFGPGMAEFHLPLLGFFLFAFRWSVPFTILGILGWEMGKPVETIEAKFPDVLPAGTEWGLVWMQFLDEENVMIHAGQYKRMQSYADMGLADNRGKTPKPNEQWKFLLVLARQGGELSFKDAEADGKYKKQKQILSEKLQRYFRIDFDPFQPYKREKVYKTKMMLIAPPKKEESKVKASPAPDFEDVSDDPYSLSTEIRSYFSDQAPIVDDREKTDQKWQDGQDSKAKKRTAGE